MTKILEDKLKKLEESLEYLYSNYNIKRIGFFGSITRNDFSKKSDIDILVEFTEAISFFKFLELEHYLSDLLGYKVDLVSKNAIKSAIKNTVKKELIYV